MLKRAQQMRDIQMTDEEEAKLGEAVSERIRQRYGVVQDPAIHKYVTLVGGVLAQASTRPGLHWRFIVLDTDGVNALAAPGGLVHITRGALSLIRSEAELAGVLGHEIIHVTEKHTIKAIQKGKMVQMGAEETVGSSGVFNKLVDKATGVVMAGFGRDEELEADRKGIVDRQRRGVRPQRAEDVPDDACGSQQGVDGKAGAVCVASRDEGALRQARRDRQGQQADGDRHRRGALQGQRHLRAGGHHRDCDRREGLGWTCRWRVCQGGRLRRKTGDNADGKPEEPKKKKGFGLGRLVAPSSGGEKQASETTGSSAARGVDTERNAKGGGNPKLVAVTVTAADFTAFKKDGKLN